MQSRAMAASIGTTSRPRHAGVDPDQLHRRLARSTPARPMWPRRMYKSDDFRPFLYKTNDYGKTWKKIVNGIPERHFTRVVREDPNHRAC